MEKENEKLITREEAVAQANLIIKNLSSLDKKATYELDSTYETIILIKRYAGNRFLENSSTVAAIPHLPPIVAPPAGTPVVCCDEDVKFTFIATSKGRVHGNYIEVYRYDGSQEFVLFWSAPTLKTYSEQWTSKCDTPQTRRLSSIILGKPVD